MKGEPGLQRVKHHLPVLIHSLANAHAAAIICVLALKVVVIALTAMATSLTNNNNWTHFKTSFFDL